MNKSAKQIISEKITNGEFTPGQKLPAERWIASELGVSRISVQHALKELEMEGLLERQPNCRPVVRKTPHLAAAKNQVAVWMLPDVQDLGGMLMLQGIRSVLGSANINLLMGCPPAGLSAAQAEVDFLDTALNNPKLAGVIVWDLHNPDCKPKYEKMVGQNIPLVFIDRNPAYSIAADFVSTDNIQSSYEAVKHLISLGHQRIACVVTENKASSVKDRVAGYRLALDSAEIPVRESLIVDFPSEINIPIQERCKGLIKALKGGSNPISAIFAVNDSIALRLLDTARQLGITVPDELSILGFDWLSRSLPSGGELTTVAQPFFEIGQAAAQRILDRMNHSEPQTPRKILFQAQLIHRGSTAPVNHQFHTISILKGSSHAQKESIHPH